MIFQMLLRGQDRRHPSREDGQRVHNKHINKVNNLSPPSIPVNFRENYICFDLIMLTYTTIYNVKVIGRLFYSGDVYYLFT